MHLFLGLSVASLIVMIVVDFILGPKAEFLNAYTVIQRLIGQMPSAGESLVAQKFGAFGEFVLVLTANFGVGGILATLVWYFTER